MAIAADRIDCDLFDWFARGGESCYRYLGDYMNRYGWAEPMRAETDGTIE